MAAYASVSVVILGLVITKTFRETRSGWVFATLAVATMCLGGMLLVLQVY